MIRIGDFSKLNRVTIKTLRYYDEVGLLKPAHVDAYTGYRYYTYNQLPRLNRILALKDLGFSLEEIKGLLTEDLTPEQMRGMLKLRQSEINQRIQDEEDRLRRVEARLRQIEREEVMSAYDIVTKEVEPIKVATVRGVVPTPPDQGRLWGILESHLQKHGLASKEPCFSLYHDDEYKEKDWDIEVCEAIEEDVPETTQVNVRSLLKVETMACVVHHGPFVTISDAYDALMKWIDENGYQIVGPCREVYLNPARHGNQNDPETITEIQFPVKKV
jgi:effector-binding domain-containing protein